MTSMYKQYETDPKLEVDGILLEYPTFRVTIARAGGANKRYNRTLERLSKPYRRAIQTETITPEQMEKILMQVYAESVILLWEVRDGDKWKKGIEDRDGTTMPFNPANVVKTFENLQEIFAEVMADATKVALFRKYILEEEAKN